MGLQPDTRPADFTPGLAGRNYGSAEASPVKAGPPRTRKGRHGRPQGRRPRHLESIPYRHHRRARVGGLGLLKGGALRPPWVCSLRRCSRRRSDPTPSATSWFASSNVSIRPTSSAMVADVDPVDSSGSRFSWRGLWTLPARLSVCVCINASITVAGQTRTRLLGAHWNAVRDGTDASLRNAAVRLGAWTRRRRYRPRGPDVLVPSACGARSRSERRRSAGAMIACVSVRVST